MNSESDSPGRTSETTRTEAFSDGVLAIAITLLTLDLTVPARATLAAAHESLAHALAREWPSYFAYVTSFVVIGIIWVNHHRVFDLIARIDRVAQFLNLLLLMSVVAIPFTTSLLAEYLTAGSAARTAAVVYSGVMFAMAIGFSALYMYIARRPALLATPMDPASVRSSTLRFSLVGLVLYFATIVIALVSAPLCLLAHLVLALYYAFQQIRAEPAATTGAA
jgi:uncharacterized membrane protein